MITSKFENKKPTKTRRELPCILQSKTNETIVLFTDTTKFIVLVPGMGDLNSIGREEPYAIDYRDIHWLPVVGNIVLTVV